MESGVCAQDQRVSDGAPVHPVGGNISVATEYLDLGSVLWEGSQYEHWNFEL